MPRVCLQSVIVVFADHNLLVFLFVQTFVNIVSWETYTFPQISLFNYWLITKTYRSNCHSALISLPFEAVKMHLKILSTAKYYMYMY